jgi:hypothetical protein
VLGEHDLRLGVELLDLSRQILELTKEVRTLAGRGDVRTP